MQIRTILYQSIKTLIKHIFLLNFTYELLMSFRNGNIEMTPQIVFVSTMEQYLSQETFYKCWVKKNLGLSWAPQHLCEKSFIPPLQIHLNKKPLSQLHARHSSNRSEMLQLGIFSPPPLFFCCFFEKVLLQRLHVGVRWFKIGR